MARKERRMRSRDCLARMLAAAFAAVVLVEAGAHAAPVLDGPVADSVPRPPAEQSPENWRFKAELSKPMPGDVLGYYSARIVVE